MEKISIVIPCLNEQDNIREIYQEVKTILESDVKTDYEFIFVDDGSTDNTLNVLRELNGADRKVKYISLSRNFVYQLVKLSCKKRADFWLSLAVNASRGNAVKFSA